MAKSTTKKKQSDEKIDLPATTAKFHFDKSSFRILEAKTKNQQIAIDAYKRGHHLFLSGAAGSGKTYIALALALAEAIECNFKKKIVIIRSVVPTRDVGFLPGTLEEKESAYLSPYIGLVNEMCGSSTAYNALVSIGAIKFMTTSFIRGITLNDSIIIVDEFQNCYGRELDSVITRVGSNSRIIFSGDHFQSDFDHSREKEGAGAFMNIVLELKGFTNVEFTWDDCVRSGLCRDYLMTKHMRGITF